ncbi:MAG: universal stress protein [Candidatus Schekmanbacteria bacterium]|nr:universal stress protein [Candidatus Schekmanbacteria bacterium]
MINLKNIMVPVDFSEDSRKALTYGISLAGNYRAKLHIVNIIDDRIYDDNLFMVYAEQEIRDNRQKVVQGKLDEMLTEAKNLHPEVEAINAVQFGIAFVAIIKYARDNDVDLIIMGSHGHTGIAHVLIGSTTEKVVRKAPCPVLVIRPREREFVLP